MSGVKSTPSTSMAGLLVFFSNCSVRVVPELMSQVYV